MPDFDKLFGKRIGEENYKGITDFLGGQTKFNDLSADAQEVLNGIEKPEHDRTFTQQEQVYELRKRLISSKLVPDDSDYWDKFEGVYRKFMLGREARNRFYKLQQRWTGGPESEAGKLKWKNRAEKKIITLE